MERAEVGKQVGEKGRGSLGGPLLIAAGRGYVPRVIAAVCARGSRGIEGERGGNETTGTPELSRPERLSRSRVLGAARRVRALDPRAFVPRSRRTNSEPVCRPVCEPSAESLLSAREAATKFAPLSGEIFPPRS